VTGRKGKPRRGKGKKSSVNFKGGRLADNHQSKTKSTEKLEDNLLKTERI